MKLEVKNVGFYGDELLGVKDENGVVWLAIKRVYKDLGFSERQCKYQVEKMNDDIVLSKGVRHFVLPSSGGKQEQKCIKEDYVTLWLAKITLTKQMQEENPSGVDKLVKYQLECAKVLHEAFMSNDEKKSEFYSQMGLQGEIVQLQNKVDSLTQTLSSTKDKLETLIDNSTINSHQAQKLNKLARERVVTILGGKDSERYKKESRKFFKNLWISVNDSLGTCSYRDINPTQYGQAVEHIKYWSMV